MNPKKRLGTEKMMSSDNKLPDGEGENSNSEMPKTFLVRSNKDEFLIGMSFVHKKYKVVELTPEEIKLLKEGLDMWKWAMQEEDLLKYQSRRYEKVKSIKKKLEAVGK